MSNRCKSGKQNNTEHVFIVFWETKQVKYLKRNTMKSNLLAIFILSLRAAGETRVEVLHAAVRTDRVVGLGAAATVDVTVAVH